MARYYKVSLPKRIATQALASKKATEEFHFADFEQDQGVTFLVSDLEDGVVPSESTVDDGLPSQQKVVGLNAAEAAEMLASMDAAERASLPDRLPLVMILVAAGLVIVLATGVVQTLLSGAREQLIEERIERPRAQHGWSGRVGASRKALGLPAEPAEKIDYIPLPTRFFPSLR